MAVRRLKMLRAKEEAFGPDGASQCRDLPSRMLAFRS